MDRKKSEMDETDHSRVFRIRYKQVITKIQGGCSFCPWHRWENAGRKPRRGHSKLNKLRRRKLSAHGELPEADQKNAQAPAEKQK